jgi:hypothetical protein
VTTPDQQPPPDRWALYERFAPAIRAYAARRVEPDARSFAPLLLRRHSEGTAVDGEPFTYDDTERVLEQRTLPDTREHREAFTLR